MRKTHIHIGGAYRRNPEREVRLIWRDVGGRGGAEVPQFEQERQSGAFAEMIGYLTMLFEMVARDPKVRQELQSNPKAREAFAKFEQSFDRARQSLGRVEHRRTFGEMTNAPAGRRYGEVVATNAGVRAREENDYTPFNGMDVHERMAHEMGRTGSRNVLDAHEHEAVAIRDGMSEEEMFRVVERAHRALEEAQARVLQLKARRAWQWQYEEVPKRFSQCPRGYRRHPKMGPIIAEARGKYMQEIDPEVRRITNIDRIRADYKRVSDDFRRRTRGVSFSEYRSSRESLSRGPSIVVHDPRNSSMVIAAFDPETDSGEFSPYLSSADKARIIREAPHLPGRMEGKARHVTLDPGSDYLEKVLTPEEQDGVWRNGRQKGPYINTFRAQRALEHRTLARNFSASALNAQPTDPMQHLRDVYEAYFSTSPAYYARYSRIMKKNEGQPNLASIELHKLYEEWDRARSHGKINIPEPSAGHQEFASGGSRGASSPLQMTSAYGGGSQQYSPDYSDPPGYDYRRDPQFSQSTIDHINRQGGDRYMQTQLRLGRMYGDEIAGRLESGEWKDLGEDPRFRQKYKNIMNVLRRQSQHAWHGPNQRYGTLAWARSQLEAMRKSQEQQDRMLDIPGEPLKILQFPVRGQVHDAGIRIVVPEEYRLEGEDGVILINDPRAWGEGPFWHSRGEDYAHKAGIRIDRFTNVDESTIRGITVEFTKPGIYEVNGRRVVVVRSSGRTWEDQNVLAEARADEESIVDAIRIGRYKEVQVSFGRHKPREFWITKDTEQPFTINPNPSDNRKPIVVAPRGIVVVRKPGPNYDFSVFFTKTGYYEFQAYDRNGQPVFHPKAKITVPEFPNQSQA